MSAGEGNRRPAGGVARRGLGVFLALPLAAVMLAGLAATGQAQESAAIDRAPHYVTGSVCAECHREAYEAWRGSHHGWALRDATAENVLGDFADQELEIHGVRSRFFRRDGRYFVVTDGPDGALQEFEIKYTVGVAPLQQYLVETDGGRLQALDLAWDVGPGQWYHLYPDEKIAAGNGLHWTGPYKNWNARCAECHVTAFEKNYDPRARSYASMQAEMGVGCEACHGPGEAHVAWARAPETYPGAGAGWAGVGDRGLTVAFAPGTARTEIQLCAGCHSRREPLGASSPPPGAPYEDHYRLALLRGGLYHADGQILDEVYVYGSFLQSKMWARGVRCTNCHEPHSLSLRGDGNGVCTRCHSPAGNPGFPTLRKAAYDGREHHFHEPGTEAARCTSCHMPESTYMVIDGRRDHSFRVPRPDLSVRLGTPNACTACHQDKDAGWAAGQVEAWYPAGRGGTPHFAEVFAAARSAVDDGTRAGLIALAEDGDLPAIVRATALDLLRSAPSPDLADAVAPLLGDADALVRAAAVSVQRGASPPLRAQRLLPLLSDPVRFVRIEVARGLLDVPAAQFPPGTGPRVRAVMGEYQASLLAKADFPESQMAIAGTALVLRNFAAAEGAFAEAAAMDPQLADAWLMVARLQLARRDLAAAEATLGQAVESLPDDGILHQSLAGVRIMAGKEAAAVAPLEAAVRLMPDNPAALTDLGTLLSKQGEHGRAVSLLEAASARGASSPELLYALAASHLALGNHDLAERTVMKLGLLYPESPLAAEARRLTGQ